MGIEELYALARREFAEDLLFGEVTLSITGLLIARAEREGHNFSFLGITETETVLAVQIGDFMVYVGIESDEPVEDFEEVAEALLEHLVPKVALLVERARGYSGKADLLLDDDMSPELKEFFYSLLMRHRQGRSPYEQTEVA